ncbi:hypothetical protein Glove_19g420 [Diversispora epigaea]|uniref:Uncharacterized protein n=1 Tax=Diversispora epigaea TaxID=1348612 RepID=A0A397JQ81_9GLOM|nr:hypothetical protein Glove_19g420 [Diversispora epigaea]
MPKYRFSVCVPSPDFPLGVVVPKERFSVCVPSPDFPLGVVVPKESIVLSSASTSLSPQNNLKHAALMVSLHNPKKMKPTPPTINFSDKILVTKSQKITIINEYKQKETVPFELLKQKNTLAPAKHLTPMPLTWCGIFLGCLGIDAPVMQPGICYLKILSNFCKDGFKLQQTKELEPCNIKLTPQNKEPEAANSYRSDEETKDLNSELAAYKKDLKVSNGLKLKSQRFEYWISAGKEKLEAKCSKMTTKKDELDSIDAGH